MYHRKISFYSENDVKILFSPFFYQRVFSFFTLLSRAENTLKIVCRMVFEILKNQTRVGPIIPLSLDQLNSAPSFRKKSSFLCTFDVVDSKITPLRQYSKYSCSQLYCKRVSRYIISLCFCFFPNFLHCCIRKASIYELIL